MSEDVASMREPADARARADALDPGRSFIVQAPAGSGKTELLIRRTLMLLAHAELPEEIIALTFTRKAAGEMRTRILKALARAREETPPPEPHERETWRLARAALDNDARRGWGLLSSPGRLRIQTLDALCATLVRRMPLVSRLGGAPAPTDDAEPLYRDAARATLALLEDGTPAQSKAVRSLLLHLDNCSGAVEELVVQMLARRDQWIRHAARHDPAGDRVRLEAALCAVRREAFEALRSLTSELASRLIPLAAWAAGNLPDDSAAALKACRDLTALPGADETDAAGWLGLADLLLTQGGSFRRRVDRRCGFPAASEARNAADKQRYGEAKQDFADLVAACEAVPGLGEALAAVGALPPPRYDEAQWEVLGAVIEVLRLAAAQLDLVFAARGTADFTAIAQGALNALGAPDAPTDLLLALDARIRHLLVDEFQDTSVTQFELIERLTAGWSGGIGDAEGRTLLLVGDPMQSIYRFREAEVGLFLRARRDGVGGLRLQPLQLSTNFRSRKGVVDWVNAAFVRVLPAREDIARGAVPYEPATDWHPAGPGEAVTIHAAIDGDPADEAARIAQVIGAARDSDPRCSIAILVRSRSHLGAIVACLQQRSIPLRAVDIEALGERPVVLDLLALTRALLHPADRIAWLAVLRAPWCGLLLADLEAVAAGEPYQTIWQLLHDDRRLAAVTADGRARIATLTAALAPALANSRRASLRNAVEGAWLRLGGADCLRAPRDLEDARAYLALLDSLATDTDAPDLADIETRVSRLFAAPDAVDAACSPPVELMTIHRAKGLEFDVVIVPGLHRKPRRDTVPLLAWAERPRVDGVADLVLGTVPATGTARDGVHAWISRLEGERERLEAGRLLYVAATRAKQKLHLLASVGSVERGGARELRAPSADSLLDPLWPVVRETFDAALGAYLPDTGPSVPAQPVATTALDPRTWRLPVLPPLAADDSRLPQLQWRAVPNPVVAPLLVEFSWAGECVRLVGTVVHRWLQRIADDPAAWSRARIETLGPAIAHELASAGVPVAERRAAVERTLAALRTAIEDERGRWVLQQRAADARAASELRLSGLDEGEQVDIAIDRTFVEGGVRWVIDYKTGSHEGAGVDAFLDREVERYRPQLERYARLVRGLGTEPVRCGLYFPLIGAWRDWAPPA